MKGGLATTNRQETFHALSPSCRPVSAWPLPVRSGDPRALDPNDAIKVEETADYIQIDTDALQAHVRKKGYVSGIEKGASSIRKPAHANSASGCTSWTSSRPRLARRWLPRDAKLHGDLPKHYVEGPQICTQAKELKPEIVTRQGLRRRHAALHLRQAGKGYKAGSTWEQTLVFQPGVRYVLSCERITSVNDVDDLFYRVDMPGHMRHKDGDTFEQVYLSYLDKPIPASAFKDDFAPDAKYLYQRKDGRSRSG